MKVFLLLVAAGAVHSFTASPVKMSLQSSNVGRNCKSNFATARHAMDSVSPLSKPLSAALAAAIILGGPLVPNALAATVANPYARVSTVEFFSQFYFPILTLPPSLPRSFPIISHFLDIPLVFTLDFMNSAHPMYPKYST